MAVALIGPLLGAGLVNGMKSWFTVAFPEFWLFFLGALFILVTLYLPKGVVGLLKKEPAMRGVPPVHPEFMLEPVFDPLGAGRDAIGLGHPQGGPGYPPRHGAEPGRHQCQL